MYALISSFNKGKMEILARFLAKGNELRSHWAASYILFACYMRRSLKSEQFDLKGIKINNKVNDNAKTKMKEAKEHQMVNWCSDIENSLTPDKKGLTS